MLQQIFSLSFMTAFLAAAVRLAVPLMYGGIGETIAEKSGILNIGMEGVMLSGAFFSFAYEVDPELLAKVLANPEMRALLNSLAKTMK